MSPPAPTSSARRPHRRRPHPRVFLEALEDRTLLSTLAPALIADINTTMTTSSNPSVPVALNGNGYFFANDGIHGIELWTTDGTPGGTQLFKDINPGSGGSQQFSGPNSGIVNANGTLYFFANDGTHGNELWKNDGTPGGTQLVRDIHLGNGDGIAEGALPPVALGNKVLFEADDGTGGGAALWGSDGTPGGTSPVMDSGGHRLQAPPGIGGQNVAVLGGVAYVLGTLNGVQGLYQTDGTSANTSLVKALAGQTGNLTAVGSNLYFSVSTFSMSGQDKALWISDGTGGGTMPLKDFGIGSITSSTATIGDLTNVNGTLFFAGDDHTAPSDAGLELWTSNGTPGGTSMVKDINPGTGSSFNGFEDDLTAFNGKLYFAANDGTHGLQLWLSNGTPGGTVPLLDATGSAINFPAALTPDGATLYFTGSNANGSGLWKSDGTPANTAFVASAPTALFGNEMLGVVGSKVYFPASDVSHGDELWSSDGTATYTGLLKDINVLTDSNPTAITNLNGQAVFVANDGVDGAELWISNGTPGGTQLVKDIFPGSGSGLDTFLGGGNLLNANGTLYFFAGDGTANETQLWKSDGTQANTQMVMAFTPSGSGSGTSSSGSLVNIGSEVYFAVDDGAHGQELWKSNGTPGGTSLVDDINLGTGDSSPTQLTVVGSHVFFLATSTGDPADEGLWMTDGTTTTLVKAGAQHILGSANGQLYFELFDSAMNQQELWVTNGTTTTLVTALASGSSPGEAVASLNGDLYFFLDTFGAGGTSVALWKSDGTSGGTGLVASLGTSSQVAASELVVSGGLLYFANTDAAHGTELWKSDGSPGGTGLFADINPGVLGSSPTNLTDVNGTLYFTADDGSHGPELWTTDGTPGGTSLVADSVPGQLGSSPSSLANVNGTLFFAATDPTHGTELWALNGQTTPPPQMQPPAPLPPAAMATITDVTSQIVVRKPKKHGPSNPSKVTLILVNRGGQVVHGPIFLVLDGLKKKIKLKNAVGVTTQQAPLGSPYMMVSSGDLAPGQSMTVTLSFKNPAGGTVHFTARVLAGPGTV
jgi:ELWxxDGT repeat protein